MRDEISGLKGAIENLGEWREETEREKKECEEREKDKMVEWEGRLKGEISEEIRGLSGIVEELRESIVKISEPACLPKCARLLT